MKSDGIATNETKKKLWRNTAINKQYGESLYELCPAPIIYDNHSWKYTDEKQRLRSLL